MTTNTGGEMKKVLSCRVYGDQIRCGLENGSLSEGIKILFL